MEKLIAVHRTTAANSGRVAYGYVWIKKESMALSRVKEYLAKRAPDDTLTDVWVCDWKTNPSTYKNVYGTMKDYPPVIDLAKNLRNQHIKSTTKPTTSAKPRIKLSSVPTSEEYFLCIPEEAAC